MSITKYPPLSQSLSPMPSDPLLGLSAIFRNDNNPNKIDLGVGVYKDASGQAPVLASVQQAEVIWQSQESSKAYIDPKGDAEFIEGMETLLLGAKHRALNDNRVRTIQTPGGSCALRIAAEYIQRCNPNATIWLSDPTWVNHEPLLGRIGLELKQYRYYDDLSHSLDFDGMLHSLQQVQPGDVVLLHGCCHNPSGEDLSLEQWQTVAELALEKGFTPFVDIAYQGIGEGIEEDAAGLRLLADTLPELIITASCSKNFAIYRERIGSFSVIATNASQADNALSQALDIIRGYYFVPPTHGGSIVKTILNDPILKTSWQQELDEIRIRIKQMRSLFTSALVNSELSSRFSHLARQQGMFSFLGLTPTQVETLRREHSIYMASSSRINLSGINADNVDYLVESLLTMVNEREVA